MPATVLEITNLKWKSKLFGGPAKQGQATPIISKNSNGTNTGPIDIIDPEKGCVNIAC